MDTKIFRKSGTSFSEIPPGIWMSKRLEGFAVLILEFEEAFNVFLFLHLFSSRGKFCNLEKRLANRNKTPSEP